MHRRSRHRKGIQCRETSLVLITIMIAATLAIAEDVRKDQANGLPDGLEKYLEARVLESNGRYREAMEAYAAAVEEAPEVNEIRLAFATFLVDVGMAGRAVEVLDGAPDPGPEGLRVRALALTQLSTRDPALLTKTEAALRSAIESNEDDPNLLFSLAQVLQRQNKFVEAEEIVAGLRRAGPETHGSRRSMPTCCTRPVVPRRRSSCTPRVRLTDRLRRPVEKSWSKCWSNSVVQARPVR